MLDVKRRDFITLLGGVAAAWPLAARAQQPHRMRHVGVLIGLTADDPELLTRIGALLQALEQMGWTDGRNIRIEYRWGSADAERIRKHAGELVALAPDVLLAARHPDRVCLTTSDPHRANRVRGGRGPGRWWSRR